jgi:nucleoside-diphosphate-sugar epimerase
MTVLVTGANGLVGSHLVEELLQEGARVRILVRDATRSAAWQERGVEVVVGDIRDRSAVGRAVRGAAVIHHCAAAIGHHSRQTIYDTNREGVRHVLEAVRQARAGRVVLLSSVNVLGTRHLDPATEDLPCRRSHDPAADVKIEAEQLGLAYHRHHGLDVTILRPGFIHGPGDHRNLPKLAETVRRGKFAFIGSRDNIVPIVHVRDVVQAMRLAGDTPAARGRIYHITDGSRATIGELVDLLAELQDVPPPRKVLPYALPWLVCQGFALLGLLRIVKGPGPVTRTALRFLGTSRFVDISRARAELGYAPRIDLAAGIADTLRWINEKARPTSPVECRVVRA